MKHVECWLLLRATFLLGYKKQITSLIYVIRVTDLPYPVPPGENVTHTCGKETHGRTFQNYPGDIKLLTSVHTNRNRYTYRSRTALAYFKPMNTLRQLFLRLKDKVLKEREVGPVYHIPYGLCDPSYIGETERSLKALIMVES